MPTDVSLDDLQLFQWLTGAAPLPLEASQQDLLARVEGHHPAPATLVQRCGASPGASWLGVMVTQAMAMVQDLQEMEPAVLLVHAWLDRGAPVNVPAFNGRTPLHEVVARMPAELHVGGNWLTGMVQALLNAGADPCLLDDQGWSALAGMVPPSRSGGAGMPGPRDRWPSPTHRSPGFTRCAGRDGPAGHGPSRPLVIESRPDAASANGSSATGRLPGPWCATTTTIRTRSGDPPRSCSDPPGSAHHP